jgi:hypothetical protein
MKKTLILISILTLFFSCNSTENEEEEIMYYGTDIAASFRMKVKDNTGKNLLDPTNPNSFDTSKIKIFYLIDGEKKEYYEEHLDYPKGFRITRHVSTLEYEFILFLNYDRTEDLSTTYIQWNENDTDTIKALFYYPPNSSSVLMRTVWYNDELKWDYELNNHEDPYFELIK